VFGTVEGAIARDNTVRRRKAAKPQSHQDTASTSIDKSHAEGWHVAGRVTRPPSLDSSLVRALAGYLYSLIHPFSFIASHRIPPHCIHDIHCEGLGDWALATTILGRIRRTHTHSAKGPGR
jgi:hypothetical protein